jgi:diphthine-ammonia ligase
VVKDAPRGVTYAIGWSGGKDSMLALDRARAAGLDVHYGLNLYNGESGRVQFHGVPHELVAEQLRRVSLEPLQLATGEHDFEATFLDGLDQLHELGVGGILFGNVHLADVRAWYEERTTRRGFAHVEPLWAEAPQLLLGELLARGYRTRVVSVDLARGREEWLGQEITQEFAERLLADGTADPLGECGEYHSFVFDGPLFSEPLDISARGRWEFRGHALLEVSGAAAP